MSRFPLRMQLFLVCLALAVGFTVFGAWTWHTISQTRIGGPDYNRIVLDKDLVADILPPPNDIIESVLTVLQLADPEWASQRAVFVARMAQLHPAVRFFDLADRQLLPAISAGDRVERQDALRYLEHRQAIDDVVALSTCEQQEVEAPAGARQRKAIEMDLFGEFTITGANGAA